MAQYLIPGSFWFDEGSITAPPPSVQFVLPGAVFVSEDVSTRVITLTEVASATDTIDATITPVKLVVSQYLIPGVGWFDEQNIDRTQFDLPGLGAWFDRSPHAATPPGFVETGNASETISATANYHVSLSEAGSATDHPDSNAAFHVALSEAGSASDAVSGGNATSSSMSESASAADTISANATYQVALSETGNATDTTDGSAAGSVSALTETGSLSDTINGIITKYAALSETGSLTDTISATLTRHAVLFEAGSATDHLNAHGSHYHVSISEYADLIDAPGFPLAPIGILFWGYLSEYQAGYRALTCWIAGLDCGERELTNDGAVFVPFQCDPDGLLTADYLMTLSNNPPGGGFGPSACNIDLDDGIGNLSRVVVDVAIGHPYRSELQLLRPQIHENAEQLLPSLAQTRRAHQYGLQLTNTAGLSVGTTEENLRAVTFRNPDGSKYANSELFDGVHWDVLDDDYDFDSMLLVRMFRPFPAKIESVIMFMRTFNRK